MDKYACKTFRWHGYIKYYKAICKFASHTIGGSLTLMHVSGTFMAY